MPKRKAEDKIAHYYKKIKKLQEKSVRRRSRVLGSSDEEQDPDKNVEMVLETMDPVQGTGGDPDPDPGEPAEEQAPPIIPESESQTVKMTDEVPVTISDQEKLDPDFLQALGAAASDLPEFGVKIHTSLSDLWSPILKKGLPKEDKENLIKQNPVPENCKLLQAPKLNAEISAAVVDIVRVRDKKLHNFQQQLGVGTTAINRGMDLLIATKGESKAQTLQVLKSLSDGCRLLSDLHYQMTKDRIRLVSPNLDKNIQQVVQEQDRDDTLFGTTLPDKIKASKAIEKQGQQIKKSTPKSAPSIRSQQSAGNWTGPAPRYPSTRGARGASRRPAAPGPRRYFPQGNQPRFLNQSLRFRAPTQQ